jgi:tetratricopeptide (TPR) repeat protein
MRLADLLLSLRRDREGYAAWREAVRLTESQQLTTRESLRLRAQFLEDTGSLAEAEKAYRTYALRYPHDYPPRFFLGSVLVDTGRSAEAEQWYLEAMRLRPSDPVPVIHLTRVLLDLGRFDEAVTYIERVRALGQADWATWLTGLSQFVRGDVRGALQATAPLLQSSDQQWRSRGFAVRTSWLTDIGDVAAARETVLDGIAFDQQRGLRDREADKRLFLAALQCRTGDRRGCHDSSLQALSTAATDQRVMRAGTLLARAGLVDAAQELAGQLESAPDLPRVQVWRLRLAGEIALARGRTREAVDLFRRAAQIAPERVERIYLARALRLAGDADDARRALAPFVEHPIRAYLVPEADTPGVWAEALHEYVKALRAAGVDAAAYAARLDQLQR